MDDCPSRNTPHDENHGFWCVYRVPEFYDNEEAAYMGCVDADEGPEDFGEDIYRNIWEYGIVDGQEEHPDKIEYAEYDPADCTIALGYTTGNSYIVRWEEYEPKYKKPVYTCPHCLERKSEAVDEVCDECAKLFAEKADRAENINRSDW